MALTKVSAGMLNVTDIPYPPYIISAVVPAAGTTVILTFGTSTVPLLPSTGVTGFLLDGVARTGARTADNEITLTLAPGVIYTGEVKILTYSPGNLRDSTPYSLSDIISFTLTNNSTVPVPLIPQTDLGAWLMADTGVFTNVAGTTPATTTGDFVKRWIDQSATATQSVTGDQAGFGNPKLKTSAINGHNSVHFSKLEAADQCLAFPAAASGVKDIFIVLKWELGRAGARDMIFLGKKNVTSHYFGSVAINDSVSAQPSYPTGLTINTWILYSARTTGANIVVDQNATQVATVAKTGHVLYDSIGIYGANLSGYSLSAEVAEIITYNAVQSTENRTAIRSYLNAKFVLY